MTQNSNTKKKVIKTFLKGLGAVLLKELLKNK